MTPLPPAGGFLQAVRDSSRNLRESANIRIEHESIAKLLSSPAFTSSFTRVSKNHGLALPLNFSSPLDELNFISILSLLNFASGYRVPLHEQTGRGAWDSIRALMFALFISSTSGEGDLLSARGLQTLEQSQISQMMGISLHVERPHEKIPGVVVGELGGPLYDLVKLIVKVLNETGEILQRSGYQNLGIFVVEALKAGEKDKGDAAEVVLEHLLRAFPAFQDMAEVSGQPIYCFKKALFLLEAISIRFGSLSNPPFPIPSTTHLPVFSDNVLPSMLVHLGVIDVSSSPSLSELFPGAGSDTALGPLLEASPHSGTKVKLSGPPIAGPVITADQAYILRAAAIDACELIVAKARTLGEDSQLNNITLPDIDMWVWAVAKDRPDYRALPRFVLTDTVFF